MALNLSESQLAHLLSNGGFALEKTSKGHLAPSSPSLQILPFKVASYKAALSPQTGVEVGRGDGEVGVVGTGGVHLRLQPFHRTQTET
jgi:hypothetical protein